MCDVVSSVFGFFDILPICHDRNQSNAIAEMNLIKEIPVNTTNIIIRINLFAKHPMVVPSISPTLKLGKHFDISFPLVVRRISLVASLPTRPRSHSVTLSSPSYLSSFEGSR